MKTFEEIMDECYELHKPSLVIASYSGGYDSMVMTHKALEWTKARGIELLTISVDTGIHTDGWEAYVTDTAKALGVERFEIWRTSKLDNWIADVKKRGFAYRPHQHKIYFYYLKQNAFRAIIQHYKQHRHDRVMFITGVRRDESLARANTPEYNRAGTTVWCNPLVYWNEYDITLYRTNHELPEKGHEKDCLCNWHLTLDEAYLQKYATEAAKIILPLDTECRAKFGYGYGEEPSKLAAQEEAGQLPLFDLEGIPNLCAGCERPKAKQEDVEAMLLQRMEW